LVHRPRDVSQDPRPIHKGPIASTVRDGVIDRPPKCSGPPRAPPYWPGITHRLLGSFSFLTLREQVEQGTSFVASGVVHEEWPGERHLRFSMRFNDAPLREDGSIGEFHLGLDGFVAAKPRLEEQALRVDVLIRDPCHACRTLLHSTLWDAAISG